jgi:hypothetical protein
MDARTPDAADESAIPGDRLTGESVVSAGFGSPRVFRHVPECPSLFPRHAACVAGSSLALVWELDRLRPVTS